MVLFVSTKSNGQNITNTLGSLGTFSIKDAGTTYLSLSQSSGNITLNRGLILPITYNSSTTGIIFKGTSRFIHDYCPNGAFGYNVFIGIDAGNFTMNGASTTSSFNTGVGSNTLTSLTTGFNNSAFGYMSLHDNTSGSNNSSFGHSALSNNTTGISNSAFGSESLFFTQTSSSLSAFGTQSLRSNTTGSQNSALGSQSLYNNTTGSSNCSFGFQSLFSNTFASKVNAFGYQSLMNSNGTNNNAFGYQSMYLNNSGVNNCAFGNLSLYNLSNGFYNVALGNNTLYANTTGNSNTALGEDAGSSVTTGSNLTLLGYNSEPLSATSTNQVTLGNSFVTSLRCNVTSITSLSDARDKKNIKELSLGLDFIAKLKPRQFNWDKREWYESNVSDGSKMLDAPTAGFIAQELDSLQQTENAEWLNLVLKDNPEKLEATTGNLLPIMVKAIQELKEKCDRLEKENSVLSTELSRFEVLRSEFEELKGLYYKISCKFIDRGEDIRLTEGNSEINR